MTTKAIEAGRKALSEMEGGLWTRSGRSEAEMLTAIYAAMCVHQVNRWIPVTERLPEEGKRVLARNSIGYCACVTSLFRTSVDGFDGEDATAEETTYPIGDVTHWMPIPELEFVAGKKS